MVDPAMTRHRRSRSGCGIVGNSQRAESCPQFHSLPFGDEHLGESGAKNIAVSSLGRHLGQERVGVSFLGETMRSEGQMDVFRDTGDSARQREDVVEAVIDLLTQLTRVRLIV